jgi:transcription antitermination factor NusG
MGEARQFISNHEMPVAAFLGGRPSATWYALKVRNGSEPSVVSALQRRGLHPYCPTQKERRRYSDRMKVVTTPVFSGYVFCSFDITKKLPVVSCPGVDYIVAFAGVPAEVPELQIENIRRMIDAGAIASEPFVAGEHIRVTHGPLAGIEGILVRESRGNRLVVSIELLNQAASLYIDQDQARIA